MTASPIGRFAPSPTHHLHLGSLTTAVASYCHIKSLGGKWLVRIEDIDFERCKDSYASSILYDLEALGLHWDAEVIYQSARRAIYEDFLHNELANVSYACHCSRKQLDAYRTAHAVQHALNSPVVYPRLCLHRQLDKAHKDSKIRLQLPNVATAFVDGLQGVVWDNPAISLGDVVLKRQNQMINYILACTIDDGLQNISHIMRGLDIMPMTVAQLQLLDMCQLPKPSYFYHLPLLYNPDGQKLSKQNLATPIDTSRPNELLLQALALLGQKINPQLYDASCHEILSFAIEHWDNKPLQHKSSLGVVHT
ncbi:glutamyl-Q tRNA(Asp) synthetase [Moraxella cuniculi DSM 21768]|uniref:Glutamyl-Q tRNA(Asp) synthetase n=1 Tax=Moraxella cuniculi DSM 21768 TaxID=1122245 RepID=A0A1N7F641_9GAMM|nr:tRNA glutamyl-Q(34) synthetase GluQRS [Moraxella cuniculi]OOS06453.1 tRNA glutamyl-Q(34) synthetase GluQRS [Moraxella cuniculi]SIR95828.1 glutamyl-Q tRNA(Asp) synthetase [Moraxella cuniculi DSM 21768]